MGRDGVLQQGQAFPLERRSRRANTRRHGVHLSHPLYGRQWQAFRAEGHADGVVTA